MEWNDLTPELVVSDYARSKHFYTHAFGFSVRFERDENRFGYFERGGAQLMLIERPNVVTDPLRTAKPSSGASHFQIYVDSLDALVKRLASYGAAPLTQAEEAWYRVNDAEHGQREFFVADPDGYLFRFCEYIGERRAV